MRGAKHFRLRLKSLLQPGYLLLGGVELLFQGSHALPHFRALLLESLTLVGERLIPFFKQTPKHCLHARGQFITQA
ncbi:hypothetical protein D3C79_958070 [compost metagenome]